VRSVLAKGTPGFIFVFPVICIVFVYIWYTTEFSLSLFMLVALAVLLAILISLTFLVIFFFRDPERTPGDGLLAPAHGRVLGVRDEDGRTRVSTFMSPFDVHVIRAPLDGKVVSLERSGSGFHKAYEPEAGHNVQVEIDFDGGGTPFTVVMISGYLARRIVPYISPGDDVTRGSRIGLIRFGSRVDVLVPKGMFTFGVQEGSRVKAGSSSLGVRAR
jgi:phosphatidylserine decarboxylase